MYYKCAIIEAGVVQTPGVCGPNSGWFFGRM